MIISVDKKPENTCSGVNVPAGVCVWVCMCMYESGVIFFNWFLVILFLEQILCNCIPVLVEEDYLNPFNLDICGWVIACCSALPHCNSAWVLRFLNTLHFSEGKHFVTQTASISTGYKGIWFDNLFLCQDMRYSNILQTYHFKSDTVCICDGE